MSAILGPSSSHASTREAVLYRCFDSEKRLLYVGVTVNLYKRSHQHQAKTSWWPDVIRIEVTPYDERWRALNAEREAIRTEGPLHNRQRNYRPAQAIEVVVVPAIEPEPTEAAS